MLNNLIIGVAEKCLATLVNRRESKVGYGVRFHNIPVGWVDKIFCVDMTLTWKLFGLKGVQGLNYFTLGAEENGLSTRFDEKSKYYQAWAGCYLFKLENPENWNIQSLYALALADQASWLKLYGCSNPVSTVELKAVQNQNPIKIDGIEAQVQKGYIYSLNDVGTPAKNLIHKARLYLFKGLYAKKAPHTITEEALEPKTIKMSHENIKLSGIIALVTLQPNIKVLFYGNGYIQDNKDTFIDLEPELLTIFQNARFIKFHEPKKKSYDRS